MDALRIDLLLRRQIDGMIVLPASEDDPATIAALRSAEVPIVAVDRDLPHEIGVNAVRSDHYAGVGAAILHLLTLGHRRIALLAGPEARPSRERIRAMVDAYSERGIPFDAITMQGPLPSERAERKVSRLLSSAHPPGAIVLEGNQLLEGALIVIHGMHLTLARDLSLICCDDVPLSRLHRPAIATIRRDTDRIGRAAATMLLRQITGRGDVMSETLPTWFEAGGSCGTPKG